MQIEKDAIADKALTVASHAKSLENDNDSIRQRADNREKLAQAEIDKLTTELDGLKADLAEKNKLFKDNQIGELARRYNWAFYLAVLGWIGFVLCAVGLASAFARNGDGLVSAPPEPPHTIT